LDNPQAAPGFDADGTGRTNLFKYVAGLNPLDPTSRFALRIEDVAGQPNQRKLIFSPIVAGRTYTPVVRTDLACGTWSALTPTAQSKTAGERSVTDLDAIGARKFYRIEIAKP